MKTAGKVFLGILVAAASYEIIIQLAEYAERYEYWKWSREYCDRVGKQLLRIGMQRSPIEPKNGDVTLDIDERVQEIPGGVHGDERNMPFSDKQFGVCFNEHTLEHLFSSDDVQLAVNECRRVADYAVLLAPSPNSLYASLFCPTHHLRLWFDNEKKQIVTRPNTWNTGFGYDFGYEHHTGELKIGQAMVLGHQEYVPVRIGRRYES